MRAPGRWVQARTRTGATGMAPRMSRVNLPMRSDDPAACSSTAFVIRARGGDPC
jgi:hypothetical protein